MPHMTLEYTGNLAQDVRAADLFPGLHHVLASVAGVEIAHCKSRVIRLSEYHVGRGEAQHAFIHLQIRLFEGRPAAVKQELGERSLQILRETFAARAVGLALQVTVEVVDMPRQGYFKWATDLTAA
jgi:5-carboxymethyl-2-hydroxymuconate isomerase